MGSMADSILKTTSHVLGAALLAGGLAFALTPLGGGFPGAGGWQESSQGAAAECTVDLSLPGMMSDILSNALVRGLGEPESEVALFLQGAVGQHPDGAGLLKAAAVHFRIAAVDLQAEVESFRHCNCTHGETAGASPASSSASSSATDTDGASPLAITQFALDVATHVVLHELAHALVREFDLPVLGNEETLADAFATHYLTAHLPERAEAVLTARVQSLMVEAAEVPRSDWPVHGEHNSDARRAFQIAAIAVAADPDKYRDVADAAGMSEEDVRRAADYGTEVHRSWRRILRPLWMPEGAASGEARLQMEEGFPAMDELLAGPFLGELRTALVRFDWHSQVTLRFVEGDGGAAWSRSKRAVTVHSGYLQRFVRQGSLVK